MKRNPLVARSFVAGRACGLFVCILACMGLALGGCALLPRNSSATSMAHDGTKDDSTGRMTLAEMELIFRNLVDAIEGPPGAIRTQVDGVDVFLLSDPANDRMRMIVKVVNADELSVRHLAVLLQLNFEATLDARYAIANGVVFATYLHPISSLTAAEIESALEQVVNLRKNFGTAFSGAVPRSGASD